MKDGEVLGRDEGWRAHEEKQILKRFSKKEFWGDFRETERDQKRFRRGFLRDI